MNQILALFYFLVFIGASYVFIDGERVPVYNPHLQRSQSRTYAYGRRNPRIKQSRIETVLPPHLRANEETPRELRRYHERHASSRRRREDSSFQRVSEFHVSNPWIEGVQGYRRYQKNHSRTSESKAPHDTLGSFGSDSEEEAYYQQMKYDIRSKQDYANIRQRSY